MCHGPAALTSARKPNHPDQPLLKGVKSTGFSNAEEAQTPYNDFVNTLPFSLEDKMKELGGLYEKADADWGVHVVNDQGILTGTSEVAPLILIVSRTKSRFGCLAWKYPQRYPRERLSDSG